MGVVVAAVDDPNVVQAVVVRADPKGRGKEEVSVMAEVVVVVEEEVVEVAADTALVAPRTRALLRSKI
jgi:hypothetical protein